MKFEHMDTRDSEEIALPFFLKERIHMFPLPKPGENDNISDCLGNLIYMLREKGADIGDLTPYTFQSGSILIMEGWMKPLAFYHSGSGYVIFAKEIFTQTYGQYE